jgi:hypothetical protein
MREQDPFAAAVRKAVRIGLVSNPKFPDNREINRELDLGPIF